MDGWLAPCDDDDEQSRQWMHPQAIKSFLKSITSCLSPHAVTTINLQGHMIEDPEVNLLLRYFSSSVEIVNLGGCQRVTDEGLKHLPHCHRLQSLCLRGCRYVEGSCLRTTIPHIDVAFTMTPLVALEATLTPTTTSQVSITGTPAIFELAFVYPLRAQLESLLLRLQMAINSANFEETKTCLLLVSHDDDYLHAVFIVVVMVVVTVATEG